MKYMVKTASLLAALSLLAGCGTSASQSAVSETQETETKTEEQETVTEETPETEEKNVLVIYFSRTGEQYEVGEIDKGNTAIVAEMIAEETGADMYEILPKEDYYPYTYDELTDVALQEQNEGARPEYRDDVPDLSQYQTIFIGSPVWWGDWPMIMYTFFENEDLSGKTLIPFSTHEGSGLAGFDRKLSDTVKDSTILKGFSVRGYDAQNKQDSVREEVKDWLASLVY